MAYIYGWSWQVKLNAEGTNANVWGQPTGKWNLVVTAVGPLGVSHYDEDGGEDDDVDISAHRPALLGKVSCLCSCALP